MGNRGPILAWPEGADDFIVYYDARSKDLEACLEKRRRTLAIEEAYMTKYSIHPGADTMLCGFRLNNRWLSMKKDIASCGMLMPRVVKSQDEIFSRWGYCDNRGLSRAASDAGPFRSLCDASFSFPTVFRTADVCTVGKGTECALMVHHGILGHSIPFDGPIEEEQSLDMGWRVPSCGQEFEESGYGRAVVESTGCDHAF
ncbi:hypothetical protein Tco_1408512 [Tanacetum coccineum]